MSYERDCKCSDCRERDKYIEDQIAKQESERLIKDREIAKLEARIRELRQ